MAATDAIPVPKKATAYRVYFPIFDADGDLVTGATGLDSEVSLDGAAFADVNPGEATEIGASGMYYLDLTSGEMTADCVIIVVKTTTVGAKTTPIVLYPSEDNDIRVNTVAVKSVDQTGVNLSTAISDVSAKLPGALSAGGFIKASVEAVAANAIKAAGLDPDVTTELQAGLALSADLATALSDLNDIQSRLPDALVGGGIKADVLSASITAIATATNAKRVLYTGTASGASGLTVTMPTGGGISAVDDFYQYKTLKVVGGTGVGQSRDCVSYVGGTRVFTVDRAWAVALDATSVIEVFDNHAPYTDLESVVTAIYDEPRSSHVIAGTFGEGVASVQGAVTGAVASVTAGVTLADNALAAAKIASDAGSEFAAAVWAYLEADIATAGSIGKKIKQVLPVQVTRNQQLSNFTFLMVDSADGKTPKTGLTVTGTRSKDGGAFGACANPTATEIGGGAYKINLDAADLDAAVIMFRFTGGASANDFFVTLITNPNLS